MSEEDIEDITKSAYECIRNIYSYYFLRDRNIVF